MRSVKKIPLLKAAEEEFPEYNREKLFAFILCGDILVDGMTIRNPKEKIPETSLLHLKNEKHISRGWYKLDHALESWNLPVKDKIFIDAGSSTGGFTEALLERGAAKVYAIDVGFNQLDFTLRRDPRVEAMEKTNIMHVESLIPAPDAAVADLSFRSIQGAAAKLLELTKESWLIALIKPQFELKKWEATFDGVIRDPDLLVRILLSVRESLLSEDVFIQKIIASPIPGRKGNREFLVYLNRSAGLSDVMFKEQILTLIDFSKNS